MDFRTSIRVIHRHWIPIVVTVVAGLVAALAYLAVAPQHYTTQTKLLLTPTGGTGTAQELVAGNNLLAQQVGTFAQLALTPLVLQPVIDDLGLDVTPAQLATEVAVAPVGQSAILAIEATADTPQAAVDLGTAVAASLSDQIETASTADASPAAIAATVAQEPTLPSGPSSPNAILSVLIGLLGGLAVAFVIVVLAEVLNVRTRNGRDLQRATDAPYLGRLPHDRSLAQSPLAATAHPSGRFTDAVRLVRSKVVAAVSGQQSPVVVVSSPDARAGTSVLSANLAVVLAETGLRVTLIDANLGSPALERLFGLSPGTGLSDALLGTVDPVMVRRASISPELTVITTSAVPSGASDLLSSPRAGGIISALALDSDIVLLDAGPILSAPDGIVLGEIATGGYLVVARAGHTRNDQVDAAVASLRSVGATVLGVALTDAPRHGADARD